MIQILTKYIPVLLLLGLFASCRNGIRDLNKTNSEDLREVRLYIDWSDIQKKPTGMTALFYPNDGNHPFKIVSNVVDSLVVHLPYGEYSVLIFNQTPEEFSYVSFYDLDSFLGAEVYIPETPSRAYNSKVRMMPHSVGTKSTKLDVEESGTRTLIESQRFTVKPLNRIYELEAIIYVNGIQNVKGVTGRLTGLSSGWLLNQEKLAQETVNQIIDDWEIIPADNDGIGAIRTTFGTFGIPVLDDVVLDLDFKLINGQIKSFSFSAKDYITIFQEDNVLELLIKIGTNLPNNVPPLEIWPSEGSFFVPSWGDEINHDIKL